MQKKMPYITLLRGIAITVSALFTILMLLLLAIPILLLLPGEAQTGNVALIRVHGIITIDGSDGLLGQEHASSEEIMRFIKKAEESQGIAAILLDINSPGGSAVASEEIAAAIKDAKKPVVALIRDVGASGAYWVASAADKVVASPVSLTGSIGVTASYLQFSGLLDEHGIGYERLVAGAYKDTGTPFRNLTAEERKLMQELLDDMHSYFITAVAENRGISVEAVRKVATGRIYIGSQAKELGLVDALGNQHRAEELLKELAGIADVEFAEYHARKPLLGTLERFLSTQAAAVGKGIGSSMLPAGSMVRT